jgi:hypothetical protein
VASRFCGGRCSAKAISLGVVEGARTASGRSRRDPAFGSLAAGCRREAGHLCLLLPDGEASPDLGIVFRIPGTILS